MIDECSICVYSSLIFLTNIFLALYYNHYTGIIDKISVYAVIFYGGYIFYNKYVKNTKDIKDIIKPIIIVMTFLSVVFLYGYGYLTDNYSFHPSESVSQMYHSLLHIISSIGHHFIISL